MSNKDQIQSDIAIGFDFVEKILQNPDLLDNIPDGAAISFLDSEHPKVEKPNELNLNKKYVKVRRDFIFL
jgi:hypothetical protein